MDILKRRIHLKDMDVLKRRIYLEDMDVLKRRIHLEDMDVLKRRTHLEDMDVLKRRIQATHVKLDNEIRVKRGRFTHNQLRQASTLATRSR